MCFVLRGSWIEPTTVETPIIVYKFGVLATRKKFVSPYQGFKYRKNKANPEVFLNLENALTSSEGVYVEIYEGYHSYKWRKNIEGSGTGGIFLIPVGANYLENNGGEIVSSQLIYLGPNNWLSRLYLKYIKKYDIE